MRQLFVILFVILSLNCQAEEMLNVSVKVINEEGSPLPNVLFLSMAIILQAIKMRCLRLI